MAQRPVIHFLAHPARKRRRVLTTQDQRLVVGLCQFLSESTPCRHHRQRRLYASASSLRQFSIAEKDEVFFELVSSPPPPIPDAAVHDGVSSSNRQAASAVVNPPEASRRMLWDWRRWFPRNRTQLEKKSKGKPHTIPIRRRKADIPIIPLDSPKQPFFNEIEEYKKHFGPAIDAEQLEDAAVLRERLASWDMQRLKDAGYCLTGMSAFWMQKNQFGKPTAAFLVGPGVTLPEHRFEKGTQVLLSRVDPLEEQPYRGSVVSTTASQIRICFPERFYLNAGTWRLDLGRPDLVFERMRAAISSLSVDVEQVQKREEKEFRRGTNGGEWREYILQGTALRDVLLKGFAPDRRRQAEVDGEEEEGTEEVDPFGAIEWETEEEEEEEEDAGERLASDCGIFSEDQRIQSWVKRYSLPIPLVMDGDMPLTGMNMSQIKAMALMVGKRISLVQGPPGTGKTKTIIQTLKLLKTHFGVPQPILVCTYTNVAVDNLVEGLAAAGLRPLRVGFGPSTGTSLLELSMHWKLERHPRNDELAALVKDEGEVAERYSELNGRVSEIDNKGYGGLQGRLRNMKGALAAMVRQLGKLKGKIYALQQEMLRDVIMESDVICTTCITAATSSLNIVDFPIVFLDEASMSTEPASLIPLMKGAKHVALIGDHKQLRPVIVSKEAQEIGLGISLFERLTREGNTPSVMLDTQYRMHPGISLFPSTEFYLGGVRDGTVDEQGGVRAGLLPPQSVYLRDAGAGGVAPSVVFLDHTGRETRTDRSRVNHAEAHIVARVVVDLLLSNPELRGADIGIIAPYVAQMALLARILTTDPQCQQQLRETLGDVRYMQLRQVEIRTVDGFEGREKEVVVFSTVRNNGAGHIGFLADRRRLNVGLTRARRALFVVGSIQTLREGRRTAGRRGTGAESWRRYAEHLVAGGLVVRADGMGIMPRNE